MISTKLTPPIDINTFSTIEETIEYVYLEYKATIMDRVNRPQLFGKDIFVNCKNWINYKAEMFWHLSSLSISEIFNILPCNNDRSNLLCMNNCLVKNTQVTLVNGQVRNICLYRGIRIRWIKEIIILANNNDCSVKKWIKDNKLHLRFTDETVDYIIIFDIKKKYYSLKTAFPLFYINSKSNFDKDCRLYKI